MLTALIIYLLRKKIIPWFKKYWWKIGFLMILSWYLHGLIAVLTGHR